MNIGFYINTRRLPPDLDWQKLAHSLLEGDAKNDRLPRHIACIYTAKDDNTLLDQLGQDQAGGRTDAIYIIDFEASAAPKLKDLKARYGMQLMLVNAPHQRHSAALLAIANGKKRIKAHHLYAAGSQPETEFKAANDNS